MHSFIFVSTNQEKAYEKMVEFSKQKKSKIIEFDVSSIASVRELIHFVSLSSTEKVLAYLSGIEKAKEEAQNSLLKTLEESHQGFLFAMIVENEENVLETIRSRCEIIRIIETEKQADNIFEEYNSLERGEKIKKLSNIKDREEAVVFLKSFLNGLILQLPKHPEFASTAESAQTALNRIISNGNVQIQLTNFLVSHLSEEQD